MDDIKIVTGETGTVSPDTNTTTVKDSMDPTPGREGTPILGKFKDVDALARAYSELEKKLGSGGNATTEEEEEEWEETENDDEGSSDPAVEQAEETLELVGLDYGTFSQEWEENGKLSDDSYKQLEDVGIPKALVDSYIAGQVAIRERGTAFAEDTVNELKSIAGTPEEYDSVVQWASANMSDADLEAYNTAVTSGNKALASMAVRGLVESYHREFGSNPTLLGGAAGADNGDVFNSVDEMTAAMSDKRYNTDPHYRKGVELKVARSNLFNRRG